MALCGGNSTSTNLPCMGSNPGRDFICRLTPVTDSTDSPSGEKHSSRSDKRSNNLIYENKNEIKIKFNCGRQEEPAILIFRYAITHASHV